MEEFPLDTTSKNDKGLRLYPKLVTDVNGNRVRVNNIQHELKVTGKELEPVEEVKEEVKEKEYKPKFKKADKPVDSGW